MKLLTHFQISTVQPWKFGNGYQIAFHTRLYMLGLKLIYVSKIGHYIPRNTFQWNFNPNINNFLEDNPHGNVVCDICTCFTASATMLKNKTISTISTVTLRRMCLLARQKWMNYIYYILEICYHISCSKPSDKWFHGYHSTWDMCKTSSNTVLMLRAIL